MIYVTVTAGYIIFFLMGYLLGCLMSKKNGEKEYYNSLKRMYTKLKAEIDRPACCPKCGEEVLGDEDGLCSRCI